MFFGYVDRAIEVKEGNLEINQRNSNKDDHPILVSPLKARTFADYDVDDGTTYAAPVHFTYADSLISPYIKSPFGHECENHLFTPFDEMKLQTYDEQTAAGKLVVEEERVEGRVSKEVFFSYFAAAGGWPIVLLILFIQCLWQGLSIGSDLYLGYWTGTAKVLTEEQFHQQAEYNITIYSLLAVGSATMVAVRVFFVSLGGMKASKTLFHGLTAALLRAPMRFFDANPLGRVLNRFSGDIGQVDGRIPWSFSYFLSTLFVLIFSLGTTMVVIRTYSVFMLPLIYIYYVIGARYVQPAREIERLSKTTKSPLMTHISESIEGAVLVRAFGSKQVRRFERQHQTNVDKNNEVLFAGDLAGQWFAFRIQVISATMLLVTTLSLVYLRGVLSPGLIGLVFNYALQITANLEGMVSIWSGLEMAMVAPERVAEYTNIEPEAPRVISGSVPAQWPTAGSLTFTNVSFRYKPNDPLVLKELNFHINAGEKIGIVGRTGAGKSSLTMALFRINEVASGTIAIDNSMAIIPQNPILFKGTLRNYLDPFDDYTDEQLWDVLTKVCMHARVSSEELKLESGVEENGENYSVGERQMLCMARALLRQSKIVVMDEATAAIDHETDQNLQRVIREEFASSTVLTVAHRLDTVLDCDRIMVFDQGRCVQCDSPDRLIAAGEGIFFELCEEGGYLDRIMSPKSQEESE
ncbi:ABC transporter-MRP [Thraustotheca clavata]|uniref:ABC transporter-MRP n=1 Tax=Thraustotheca clavata TaxID=74557 RepID=A0A1W0A131_9STRA|nr:ABC transporter-MRP [Thraustotheca clavata]